MGQANGIEDGEAGPGKEPPLRRWAYATFVVLFLLVVLSILVYYYAARQQSPWAESARFLSAFSQIQAFGSGRIDFRTIALHLSVCVFSLFLTVKILEIHRGR